MWGKSGWYPPWRWDYHNTLRLPTLFSLGFVPVSLPLCFALQDTLHPEESWTLDTSAASHHIPWLCHRGKLRADASHLLLSTEVCSLPGLSSSREAASGCEWQMLTDSREPAWPASPLLTNCTFPANISVCDLSPNRSVGRPSWPRRCPSRWIIFHSKTDACNSNLESLLLSASHSSQDKTRPPRGWPAEILHQPGTGPGAHRHQLQLREHKGINNSDSVRGKTNLRNNSPPKPHQNFNLYRLLAP